jgi:hypothetical protein
LYALSLCKQCYQTNYSKKRRRKRRTTNLSNKTKESFNNSKNCKDFVELVDQNPKNQVNFNIAEIPKQMIDNYIKNNNNNILISKKKKRDKCNFFNIYTPLGSSVENHLNNIGNFNNSGNSRNSKNTHSDDKYPSEDLIPHRVSGDFDYMNSSNLYLVNNEKLNNKIVEYNDYGTSEQGECASGTSNYSDFVNFI